MKFHTKVFAALAAAISIAFLTAGPASATSESTNDLFAPCCSSCPGKIYVQTRTFRGRYFELVRCNTPSWDPHRYRYRAEMVVGGRHGDVLELAYVPYGAKGFVPGSLVMVEGNDQHNGVETPSYYANPTELQACILVDEWRFACTWP